MFVWKLPVGVFSSACLAVAFFLSFLLPHVVLGRYVHTYQGKGIGLCTSRFLGFLPFRGLPISEAKYGLLFGRTLH